jgi:hypothetical protein
MKKESKLDSRQKQPIFHFSKASTREVKTTRSPIQCVPGFVSLGSVKLTIYLHPVPRLRMRGTRCPDLRMSQSSGVKASTEGIFGAGVSVARIATKPDWTFRGSNLRIFLFPETSGVALEPTQPPMGTRVIPRW